MIKKTKIGNTEIGVQAGYHYRYNRIIGVTFSRTTSPSQIIILPTRYDFMISFWKYVFKIGLTNEKKENKS